MSVNLQSQSELVLPNLIGIGVPRAGTTWITRLLDSHPSVFMSPTKEIHFFDNHYAKGHEWYSEFFKEARGKSYPIVGEFTPHYLFKPEVPERIAQLPTATQLIVMLRNPVDRAFSHYRWRCRQDGYRGSFEEFLEDYPQAIEWGQYAWNLKRYISIFGEDKILCLIHEHVFNNSPVYIILIANFLGIDPNRFPEKAGQERVNRAYIPKRPTAYKLLSKASQQLRRAQMGWALNLVRSRLGGKDSIAGRQSPPRMKPETRTYLLDYFSSEAESVEQLLNTNLDVWRK